MRLATLATTCATAALLLLPVAVQASPSQEINDPMAIPAGMQPVPTATNDLPAGIDPSVLQNGQPAIVQAAATPSSNGGMPTPAEQQAAASFDHQRAAQAAIEQAAAAEANAKAAAEQAAAARAAANAAQQQLAAEQAAAARAAEQAAAEKAAAEQAAAEQQAAAARAAAQPAPQIVPAPQQAPQSQPAPQAQQPAPAPAPQQQAETAGQCPQAMPVNISHGITYMTGGTTSSEVAQLKALDGEFNMQLLFAAKNGDHLINHQVRILDYHNFELVKAQKVGPYFYMHINPGDYVLEVTYEAGMKPVQMKIKVPAKNRLRKTILLK